MGGGGRREGGGMGGDRGKHVNKIFKKSAKKLGMTRSLELIK